jgi:hypothetical protein
VADLEPHAEFLGVFVEEEDGEDAIGDGGSDELRGAVEQGAEVKRGVEGLGEAEEVIEVGGLDACVEGLEVVGAGGAIVSFHLRLRAEGRHDVCECGRWGIVVRH